jgi:1,4-dihydroxy-2-naphthoate octaprenyltransferase
VKTTKFKKLLFVGLGNIVSGIFFGAGCIMIEHVDNTWWHAEKDTSTQDEVAADEDTPSSTPVGLTAVKAANNDRTAPEIANRRSIK